MSEPVKRRLGRRIGAIVGLTVAAFGLAGTFLVLSQTSQTQESISMGHLDTLAHSIDASFGVFDERTEQHAIAEIAAELGGRPHVERIDVFDHVGRIRWSSDPHRRGRLVDARALTVLTSTSVRQVAPMVGITTDLYVTRALRRRAACLPCHQDDPDPLGGVFIRTDRDVLFGNLVEYTWRAAALVVAFSIVLIFLLLFLLNRTVVARLSRLVRVMTAAEQGDYMVRAEVEANDEIGLLTTTFNRMIAKITDLRVEHIETEREMVVVKDELNLKQELAKKSELLEGANRRLSAHVTELSFLNRLARDLATKLDLDFTLSRFCEDVTSQLNVPEVAVLMFNPEEGRIHALKWHGFQDHRDVSDRPFPVSEGVTGETVRMQAPIYVPDTSTDHRAIAYRTDEHPTGSLFCVPMMYQGDVTGVLAFSSPVVEAFSESERELLVTIANQASLALANARLFQATLELTRRDGLTGILNRRALEDRLELEWSRAVRDEAELSVVMLDIDNFKNYNDQHGHQTGDDVLRRVAQLFEHSLRNVDAVARYGGEEFAVILPRNNKDEAIEVAKKLRRAVAEADFPRGYLQPLGRVTISCGVATAPQDAASRDELVRRADEALLAAKEGGRNRVYVFEDGRTKPA